MWWILEAVPILTLFDVLPQSYWKKFRNSCRNSWSFCKGSVVIIIIFLEFQGWNRIRRVTFSCQKDSFNIHSRRYARPFFKCYILNENCNFLFLVLQAINDDNTSVPNMLTNYILNGEIYFKKFIIHLVMNQCCQQASCFTSRARPWQQKVLKLILFSYLIKLSLTSVISNSWN